MADRREGAAPGPQIDRRALLLVPGLTLLLAVFLVPLILAAATVAWGVVGTVVRAPGKGCSGAFAGLLLGIVYGTGTFFGSIMLRILLLTAGLRGDGCTAERIAWLMSGAIVGAITGACLERDRQRMFEPAGSRT